MADHRVRKVTSAGIITTIAGTGNPGYNGDNIPAAGALLNAPEGVAVEGSGVYVSDTANNRIRLISPQGLISTVVGTGVAGFAGDGGAVASARIYGPRAIVVDGSTLYFADTHNHRIRRISSGRISTVAGAGIGFSGDGGLAANAQFDSPRGVAIAPNGDLIIADTVNDRVRRVSGNIVNTIAGTTTYVGDGGPASNAARLCRRHLIEGCARGGIFLDCLINYGLNRCTIYLRSTLQTARVPSTCRGQCSRVLWCRAVDFS